ncbi:unnamed protein product [Macrosiphum euphorbiae]|uniref:Uncharacterized protein n=2 Tax=Macrosiphum euphorbiae TaxID=13131 RepID=A0AAV0WLB8_9HEMI|nr:unnamed protein product [Macrosiphum euphorbiae]
MLNSFHSVAEEIMECKKVIRGIIVFIIVIVCAGIKLGIKIAILEHKMKKSEERAMQDTSHFTYQPFLQADNEKELEESKRNIDDMMKRFFRNNFGSFQHETSYTDSGIVSDDVVSDDADQMDE